MYLRLSCNWKTQYVIFPCRKPRLSSIDIEQKMASRRLIKLSQLPDRLARDNLEDSDWVTFAVVINKITPQSKSNVRVHHFRDRIFCVLNIVYLSTCLFFFCRGKPSAFGSWMIFIIWKWTCLSSCLGLFTQICGRLTQGQWLASSIPIQWRTRMVPMRCVS